MASSGRWLHKLSINKNVRLVEWNVELLLGLLKRVVARRNAAQSKKIFTVDEQSMSHSSGMTIDEVCEVIKLPKFDAERAKKERDPDSIELPTQVKSQLREFVTAISDLYQDNVSVNRRGCGRSV